MPPFKDSLEALFSQVISFMEQGGWVMWPLVLAAVILWVGLGYRIVTLRRGVRGGAREAMVLAARDPEGVSRGFMDAGARIAAKTAARAMSRCISTGRKLSPEAVHSLLDDSLYQLEETMGRLRTLVRTVVSIAPLMGLLGTVTGMIEMFQSLGDRTFYSQSGGVANGISEALFTTEFGLVIAIPGLIIGLLLDRKEDAMKQDLLQIKNYFSGRMEAKL